MTADKLIFVDSAPFLSTFSTVCFHALLMNMQAWLHVFSMLIKTCRKSNCSYCQ